MGREIGEKSARPAPSHKKPTEESDSKRRGHGPATDDLRPSTREGKSPQLKSGGLFGIVSSCCEEWGREVERSSVCRGGFGVHGLDYSEFMLLLFLARTPARRTRTHKKNKIKRHRNQSTKEKNGRWPCRGCSCTAYSVAFAGRLTRFIANSACKKLP